MDLKLEGKRALVTGASRGLGYATALGLSREGVRVVMNSRSQEKIEQSAAAIADETGNEVVPLAGDVTETETAARLVRQTVEALGGLDLLVTNSGGPPSGKFESFDDEAWEKALQLNLMSHVRLIREAVPHLRKSEAASVLTFTSYSVKQPIPNLVLSNSIRAAVIGLTKTLSLELGGDKIRFNSILPAWTETERMVELLTFRANQSGTTVEEEIRKQAKESPLGRVGKPEEFANVAVFLLSPAASFITGVMLTVDGGMVRGTF